MTILILSIIDAEEFVIPNNEFSIWIYYCLDDKYQDDMSEMKHTLFEFLLSPEQDQKWPN